MTTKKTVKKGVTKKAAWTKTIVEKQSENLHEESGESIEAEYDNKKDELKASTVDFILNHLAEEEQTEIVSRIVISISKIRDNKVQELKNEINKIKMGLILTEEDLEDAERSRENFLHSVNTATEF